MSYDPSSPDTPPAPAAAGPPLVRTANGRRTLEFAPGDIQSEMLLARPDALVLDYARAMMGFAWFVPRPRHIMLVGLGGGSLVKFCHRHFPQARITAIEVRADVIALRDMFRIPPDDARLRVVHADARAYLAALAALAASARTADAPDDRPDVLLVDGFDAGGLPPALADARFYRDCRRALLPGGMLVANVFTYDPRHDAVLAALAACFDGRLCWLDGATGNNRIVYALDAPDPAAPAARRQRRLARRQGFGHPWLNRFALPLLLAWIARRSVLGAPHAAISTSLK